MLHSSAPRGALPAKEVTRAQDTGNAVSQHRQSRESPGDDSETDDSEFQAPQHVSRSSLEHFKSNKTRVSSERDPQRPSTAGAGGRLGERVQEGGESDPDGVGPADANCRNTGCGGPRSSASGDYTESR